METKRKMSKKWSIRTPSHGTIIRKMDAQRRKMIAKET